MLLIIWVLLMIAGASNGVNLTDGLDGLATGAAVMVFGAFVIINIWQSNQNCSTIPGLKCYEVRDPLDLAVVAAALTGACFGFLWWNASPAKIFMGDTGSLSLGGAMAGFALMTRTELLLVVIGGLFVAITASVILQVGYFKISWRQTHLPDGAAAAPLRAAGLGRDHHRRTLLDHQRPVRRDRTRASSTPSGSAAYERILTWTPWVGSRRGRASARWSPDSV